MRMSAEWIQETMGMSFTEIAMNERSQTQRKTSPMMLFVKQSFLVLALLVTFETRELYVKGHAGHCRASPRLHQAPPLPHCDNQRCLQAPPNALVDEDHPPQSLCYKATCGQ